jgi:hypothetical protein
LGQTWGELIQLKQFHAKTDMQLKLIPAIMLASKVARSTAIDGQGKGKGVDHVYFDIQWRHAG